MKSIQTSEIFELPIADKIKLVEDIWDSIADNPEKVPIPEWHKTELKKRMKHLENNPNDFITWEEAKEKLLRL